MGRRPDSGSSLGSGRLGPLTIYGYYRVLLAAAIAFLFVANLDSSTRLGSYRPQLFLVTSAGYFFVALLSSLTIRLVASRELVQGAILIGIDIVALTLLAHSSGGISSTITPLLVVTVAAAGILLPGRTSIVVAAAATLAMLYEQFYFALENGLPLTVGSTQVGLLGVAFFGVAFATGQLARRMQASEQLVYLRSREVVDLEQLNAHIIQRMRTGILVVDEGGTVQLANSSAQNLLSGSSLRTMGRLADISEELARRVATWREDVEHRAAPFRSYAGGPDIDASMAAIRLGDRPATLVFLEDMSQLSQHLQQMKLASLGRLTASIAHEIRNPLSAINHAAQLLAESPELAAGDRRLTEIIQQQALRLDRTVENVLQLSRRQVPRSDLLELVSWLQDFRRDYLGVHGKSDDELEVVARVPRIRARFDPNQLQQILQNLCDNGLRHGRKAAGRGYVRIEAGNAESGDLSVLRIFDNGGGVPAEKLANLFEPFFTTEPSGTGLGLYIARELCEANRARLSYIPASEGKQGYFQIAFSHPGRIAS
ncbi:MAG: ATP-binding protein [Pseudomonadota bacterium]